MRTTYNAVEDKWVKIRLIKLLSTYVVYWTWFFFGFVQFYYVVFFPFALQLNATNAVWQTNEIKVKKICYRFLGFCQCVLSVAKVWNSLKNYLAAWKCLPWPSNVVGSVFFSAVVIVVVGDEIHTSSFEWWLKRVILYFRLMC